MDEAVKSKKSLLDNYYVRIIGTLLVITAVVAVLLALVNMVTAPTIATLSEEKEARAIAEVIEGADGQVNCDIPDSAQNVQKILKAMQGDTPLGYCVRTSTNGNDGEIQLMVGIDMDGHVTKVSILKQGETMHVGKQGELVARFSGKSGSVALSQDGGDISAISGATISSRAITKGVNSALEAVAQLQEGGTTNG